MPSSNPFHIRPLHRNRFLNTAAAMAIGVASGLALVPAFSQNTAPAAQALARPAALAPVSFADVVERVSPAVVSVKITAARAVASSDGDGDFDPRALPDDHPLRRFFDRGERGRGFGPFAERGDRRQRPERRAQSQGSGFFISADGEIVTNNHVVEGATDVEIVTNDGRTLQAKVVGSDPRTDLALLKVKNGGTFPFVSLTKTAPRIGDWVLAVGNPFGLGGTVTSGIVSARGRDIGAGPYDDFLQIDAAVNRGNSGGPTFDLNGEVVGVNTAIYSPSGGNVGIAFAIPAATVQAVVTDLRANGSVTRGYVGVQMQPVTAEIAESVGAKAGQGALVVSAEPGTPAARAGVKSGDIILAVNDEAVKDPRDLARKIGTLKPGTSVALKLWRDGRETRLSMELGRQPGTRS
ncbi:MAG: trypsin-like peptidase domain-containing protein [Beijerinckiaceae bacterium]